MSRSVDPAVAMSVNRRSVVLGLGRPQERRLLSALREEPRLRILARCSSAPEVLHAIRANAVDVLVLDEDLHLLDEEHLGHIATAGVPALVLVHEPDSAHWQQWQSMTIASAEADALEVLSIVRDLQAARRGARPKPAPPVRPASAAANVERSDHLQVISFWSGPGSPGRTTLAVNSGVLLGWAARTVIVDLDLTGAAITAQLDQTGAQPGRRGQIASSILQIASANPDTPERWGHEIFRVARPLGRVSPHADLLAGVLQPRLRLGISASFVRQLIVELRRHYAYVLLDLGDESPGEPGHEAAVAAAALSASDQIVVVCPPDGPGLHQTYMALAEAGTVLDRTRAGLVVNRFDPRHHQSELARVEDALELPLVGILPVDTAAIQRALSEGRPVVCDPRSRLQRPLQELAERVHGGFVDMKAENRAPRGLPWLRRTAGAVAGLASGAVSGLGVVR